MALLLGVAMVAATRRTGVVGVAQTAVKAEQKAKHGTELDGERASLR